MTHQSGWVKLHRKIQNSAALKGNPQREFVFIKIIMNAAYEDGDDLLRGQWRTTIRELATMTGCTPQNVSTHLKQLSIQKAITIQTLPNRVGTVLTVCNYEEYQAHEEPTKQKANRKQTETKQQPRNYKEKKVKEVKELDLGDRFDEFWDLYAYKVGDKRKAHANWQKAINEATVDEILEGVRRYNAHLEALGDRAPNKKYPEGWLSGRRWNDNLSTNQNDDVMQGMTPEQYQQYLLNGGR